MGSFGRVRRAIELNLAAVGGGQTAQDARERGFARAIAADEGVDFAAFQREIEVNQNGNVVALLQSGDLQEWSGHGPGGYAAANCRNT